MLCDNLILSYRNAPPKHARAHVHAQVVEGLVACDASGPDVFEWVRQVRHYWDAEYEVVYVAFAQVRDALCQCRVLLQDEALFCPKCATRTAKRVRTHTRTHAHTHAHTHAPPQPPPWHMHNPRTRAPQTRLPYGWEYVGRPLDPGPIVLPAIAPNLMSSVNALQTSPIVTLSLAGAQVCEGVD